MPLSLSLYPPDATPIGRGFSVQELDGKVHYFHNLWAIDVHDADDTDRRDWRVAFFVAECDLNRQAVADAFGMSVQAVQRLVQQYRAERKEWIALGRRPQR